jgi:hypothetical protein
MGKRYDGNDRGFSKSDSASGIFQSKSVASVTVETDPKVSANPLVRQDAHGGFAVTRDALGNVTAAAQANSPAIAVSRDQSGNVVVNIDQDVKNPLSPALGFLTPGISASLTVIVSPDASTLSYSGSTSQFPANELNIASSYGTEQVFGFMPNPDATPFSLYLPNNTVQGGCSIGVDCDSTTKAVK